MGSRATSLLPTSGPGFLSGSALILCTSVAESYLATILIIATLGLPYFLSETSALTAAGPTS